MRMPKSKKWLSTRLLVALIAALAQVLAAVIERF